MYSKLFLSILLIFSLISLKAQDSLSQEEILEQAQEIMLYEAYVDSMAKSFTYESGEISLKDDLATIIVPTGYKYLNGEDSEKVLTQIWGNPPSGPGNESLGMLFPENTGPLSDSAYAINITYAEEGYVKDEDADDIDYDDLLESMQEDTKTANEYRRQQGFPTVELVGWASPPYYDAVNKKLHWAKELAFEGGETNTLNYNIRILGRKGFLQLNVIGEMYVLEEVKARINPILSSVNFDEGNTYADFDPEIDKVAAYGIGALVAGKILTKAGLFAKLGIFLAKFWKILAIGVVAAFAGLKRILGGKKDDTETTA